MLKLNNISKVKGYAKTPTNHPNSMIWSSQGTTGKNRLNGMADTALQEQRKLHFEIKMKTYIQFTLNA